MKPLWTLRIELAIASLAERVAWRRLSSDRAAELELAEAMDALEPGHARDAVAWCYDMARVRAELAHSRWNSAAEAEMVAAGRVWLAGGQNG
jgi:hypothetical protein